jgi:hypothetical protein
VVGISAEITIATVEKNITLTSSKTSYVTQSKEDFSFTPQAYFTSKKKAFSFPTSKEPLPTSKKPLPTPKDFSATEKSFSTQRALLTLIISQS